MVRRTTIRMEEGLLRAAQELGRTTRRTLTAVIEDAVRECVSKPPGPGKATTVRLPVSRQRGGVYPGVDLDHNAALRDRMEGVGDPVEDGARGGAKRR